MKISNPHERLLYLTLTRLETSWTLISRTAEVSTSFPYTRHDSSEPLTAKEDKLLLHTLHTKSERRCASATTSKKTGSLLQHSDMQMSFSDRHGSGSMAYSWIGKTTPSHFNKARRANPARTLLFKEFCYHSDLTQYLSPHQRKKISTGAWLTATVSCGTYANMGFKLQPSRSKTLTSFWPRNQIQTHELNFPQTSTIWHTLLTEGSQHPTT